MDLRLDHPSPARASPLKYTGPRTASAAFTVFGSLAKDKQVTARLIVRRVPDVNPANQNPLFTVYRYHAVFTNSPLPMLEAEKAHRVHAIVEQVIADLKNGPIAHLPLRVVPREQRLAGLRRDGVQPHPRRRRSGRPSTPKRPPAPSEPS